MSVESIVTVLVAVVVLYVTVWFFFLSKPKATKNNNNSNNNNNKTEKHRKKGHDKSKRRGSSSRAAGAGAGVGAGAGAAQAAKHGIPQDELVKAFKGHSKPASAVAFSADGRYAATGSEDGIVFVFVLTAKEPRSYRITLEFDEADQLAFTGDGKVLAVATKRSKKVHFYEVHHKAQPVKRKEVELHHSRNAELMGLHMPNFAALPASVFLVTACKGRHDPTIRFTSVKGHKLANVRAAIAEHYDMAVSANARFVALAGWTADVPVWTVHQDKLGAFEKVTGPFSLTGHTAQVQCVALSADGIVAATASKDLTLRFFNLNLRHRLQEEPIPTGCVELPEQPLHMAMSPDGKLVVVCTPTNKLLWYSSPAGKAVGSPTQLNAEAVKSLTFSPDGSAVATIQAKQKHVRLWKAPTGSK